MSITATVKSIQDTMRQDAGIDGDAQRIGQLAWMLFLKILDDREAEAELLDDDFVSPIPDELRWRTWAAPKEGITGETLLTFINSELFPTLKRFSENATNGRTNVVGNVFQDAFNYMKNGTLIRQVVNKINSIDFNRSEDRNLFGDIYEQILKDLQSAGNSGEYYTPRAVTQFMIDMVAPQLGETVLDPACGTGGFLTGAIEYVRAAHVRTPNDEAKLQLSIRGVEKKQLPHLLCTTNMLLHGIDVPTNVIHDNTLARPLRDYGNADRVDIILTNPPFGGTEEPGVQDNFPQAFRTRETADLFLVLIEHLLKDGGRAAVVLPDGTLFGEGVKARIKEKLLTRCNLHTIVRLPRGVFNPYTPTATNLLFFVKGEPTSEIWFYEHKYPVGYKSYSKTKPIRIEEFEAEKAWWHNRVESETAWKVSIENIKANNWNLDVANPVGVSAEHRDPEQLLREYHAILAKIDKTQAGISSAIVPAIDGWSSLKREVFDGSFGHVARSGAGKLRQLVLDLAVQGRLSSPLRSDGESSDLLARSAATKLEQISDGIVPRPRALPGGASIEAPLELPDHWEWARIEEIATYVQRGKGPTYADFSSIPVVSQKCIQWSGFDSSRCRYVAESSLSAYGNERFLLRGDLLWNSTGTGTVGRIAVFPGMAGVQRVVADSHVTVIRLAEYSSDFLHIWLSSRYVQELIDGITTGSTNQQELNATTVRRFLVPVAPLAEQQRIVRCVRELQAMLDSLEEQLAEADLIRRDLAASVTTHAATAAR